jgi:hypothetical protein
LNKNAENAKHWRANNPDKVAVSNQSRLENIKIHYSNYKRSANDKNLNFEISTEEFDKIIKAPCHYCGIIQERGFNGVDRVNSEVGYVTDNCVSACSMCNYMKASLSENAFLGRVEHILTYNGRITGRLFPEMFPDYSSSTYNRYKNRALDKNLEFTLSHVEFDELKSQPCYLCGKPSNSQHLNGIDRIDNNKGYMVDNVKSCCFGCNHIKRNYVVDDMFNKFMDIYLFKIVQENTVQTNCIVNEMTIESVENSIANHDTNNELIQTNNKDMVANANKKTDEEKREAARIRKANQRLRLKEKYGNDEYNRQKAEELAKYRKNKKTEI